jgi:hypothetical protein
VKNLLFWGTLVTLAFLPFTTTQTKTFNGPYSASSGPGDYKLLAPISHGNLTIFPVVSTTSHDTAQFLTLDEGIRSGEVQVMERGNLGSMIRHLPPGRPYTDSAQVNQLVLVNNSKRPLILLAGEVVTGGKQDRVVGKDRIVPAESDPIDLSVFCVEHGRWVGSTGKFDTHASVMAQPSVRKRAMADADQSKVWEAVSSAKANMSATITAASPAIAGQASGGTMSSAPPAPTVFALRELDATSSYAKVIENGAVRQEMQAITEPMQKAYESLIKQLRNQNAVGVVVAIRGHVVWADIFASNALLSRYWPKLLQSYAAETLTYSGTSSEASIKDAQSFLNGWDARHETVDSEPGLYRQRELFGDRFRAFELTSLLSKNEFDVHLSKMAE